MQSTPQPPSARMTWIDVDGVAWRVERTADLRWTLSPISADGRGVGPDRFLAHEVRGDPSRHGPRRAFVTTGIVIVAVFAVLAVVTVATWAWLRSASPKPPGQHRGSGRVSRRDPHDPIRQDDEEPPEQP
jgi:hypothetical protein